MITLPRPGASGGLPEPPVAASSEAAFTSTFGSLLPPASFVSAGDTAEAKAAYYSLLPTEPAADPRHVLVIHGIQTPALGMLPLTQRLRSTYPSTHFVLLELYGHGLSATPQVTHTPELFCRLIDALLETLSWESAHFVGYSFGGSTAISYLATRGQLKAESLALVAPAGLYRCKDFNLELLYGDDEVAARDYTLNLLEGGPLVVPTDWEARVARGEVVAQALKAWQLREHEGHAASVLSMLRYGGVMDRHEVFRKAARLEAPVKVVLGGEDDVCTMEELRELGFGDVKIVEGAGHAVVRENVPEIAALIEEFWDGLSSGVER